jgi:hypothetical protein
LCHHLRKIINRILKKSRWGGVLCFFLIFYVAFSNFLHLKSKHVTHTHRQTFYTQSGVFFFFCGGGGGGSGLEKYMFG